MYFPFNLEQAFLSVVCHVLEYIYIDIENVANFVNV